MRIYACFFAQKEFYAYFCVKIRVMVPPQHLVFTSEVVRLVAEIDEFKGAWQALGNLAPDKLLQLKKVATVESIGSSTRIEGSKLTDRQVDRLLSGLHVQKFDSRDEQEVVGYAELMDTIFVS